MDGDGDGRTSDSTIPGETLTSLKHEHVDDDKNDDDDDDDDNDDDDDGEDDDDDDGFEEVMKF